VYFWLNLGCCNIIKKRKEIPRFNKSHICPDHARCATLTTVVMWGGVLDLVNSVKSRQN